jgi:hypothetical protein
MWDFVMDKSGAGADFLRELRFPLPIYIPSASPQSSSLSPEAGTIGQECRSAVVSAFIDFCYFLSFLFCISLFCDLGESWLFTWL